MGHYYHSSRRSSVASIGATSFGRRSPFTSWEGAPPLPSVNDKNQRYTSKPIKVGCDNQYNSDVEARQSRLLPPSSNNITNNNKSTDKPTGNRRRARSTTDSISSSRSSGKSRPVTARRDRGSKKTTLYKTELCRSFEETGSCRYGTKCQFSHGSNELRPIQRHPKYKTEICRTFWEKGTCPYGKRCCFVHNEGPGAMSFGETARPNFGSIGSTTLDESTIFSNPTTEPAVDQLGIGSSTASSITSSPLLTALNEGIMNPLSMPMGAATEGNAESILWDLYMSLRLAFDPKDVHGGTEQNSTVYPESVAFNIAPPTLPLGKLDAATPMPDPDSFEPLLSPPTLLSKELIHQLEDPIEITPYRQRACTVDRFDRSVLPTTFNSGTCSATTASPVGVIGSERVSARASPNLGPVSSQSLPYSPALSATTGTTPSAPPTPFNLGCVVTDKVPPLPNIPPLASVVRSMTPVAESEPMDSHAMNNRPRSSSMSALHLPQAFQQQSSQALLHGPSLLGKSAATGNIGCESVHRARRLPVFRRMGH